MADLPDLPDAISHLLDVATQRHFVIGADDDDLDAACVKYLSARGYVVVRRDDYDNLAVAIYDTPVNEPEYSINLDRAARRLGAINLLSDDA
jgi:hypothetical protein